MDGYAAYQQRQSNLLQRRTLELEAFLKATRLFELSAQTPTNRRRLREAVSFARKLWTLIQADVTSAENKTSDTLKADLLSLSLYVDRETFHLNRQPSRQRLTALADLHRNLARSFV